MVWLTGGVHRLSASWRSGNSSSRCPVAVSGELYPATVQPAPSPPTQMELPWVAHMALEGQGTLESLGQMYKRAGLGVVPACSVMDGFGNGTAQAELLTSPLMRRAAGDGQLFQHTTDCAPCKKIERSCRTSHLQMGSYPCFRLIFCSGRNANTYYLM